MRDQRLYHPIMLSAVLLLFKFFQAFAVFACVSSNPIPRAPPTLLNITTISANARLESTLECWQLSAPSIESATAGVSGAAVAQLGDTVATSFGVIPAEFDGGLHNAPAVQ